MVGDEAARAHELAEPQAAAQSGVPAVSHLFESLDEGCFSIDASGRFTYVNLLAAHALGQTRNALLGRVFWERLPEPSAERLRQQVQAAAHSGRVVEFTGPIAGSAQYAVRIRPTDNGCFVYLREVPAGAPASQPPEPAA
ncbi:MAG TPA: PAS domain-containing protein, partial [Dehalococcoidia bacterium]|nr:PAS domain-containing protein [Dehalococcoidia bacterium]